MAEAGSYNGDLRNKDRRNWVKCTLGFQEIANAVKEHVRKTFDNYFHNVNNFLSEECCHNYFGPGCPCLNSEGYCECCQGGHKGNCNQHVRHQCHHVIDRNGRWTPSVSCKACESALAQLKKLINRGGTANWDNIYFPDVFRNSWAVAKIFMPRGHGTTDHPDQADAHCLLTIMKNCTLFNVHDLLLKKVIEHWNVMIHRDALKVSDQTTQIIYGDAIAFLEELQERNNCSCASQIQRLEELKSKVVVTELCDVAIEENIQGLMKNIKERLANGEDARDLMKRLANGNDDGVTAEMNDEEIERDIENLLSEIKDRLANNEDAMDLMDRLRIVTPRSPSVRAYFFLGPYQM